MTKYFVIVGIKGRKTRLIDRYHTGK